MRGKKAKLLRRVAERVTQGKPDRLLMQDIRTGQARNSPESTRGVYRAWKKVTPKGHTPFTEAREVCDV